MQTNAGAKYLSKVLATPNPYQRVLESYIAELTGDSLQSPDQLFKAVVALGLDSKGLKLNKGALKPIFVARNQIIHELDIDLDGERRKRNIRRVTDMITWTDTILSLTKTVVNAVDEGIPPNRRVHRTRYSRAGGA